MLSFFSNSELSVHFGGQCQKAEFFSRWAFSAILYIYIYIYLFGVSVSTPMNYPHISWHVTCIDKSWHVPYVPWIQSPCKLNHTKRSDFELGHRDPRPGGLWKPPPSSRCCLLPSPSLLCCFHWKNPKVGNPYAPLGNHRKWAGLLQVFFFPRSFSEGLELLSIRSTKLTKHTSCNRRIAWNQLNSIDTASIFNSKEGASRTWCPKLYKPGMVKPGQTIQMTIWP